MTSHEVLAQPLCPPAQCQLAWRPEQSTHDWSGPCYFAHLPTVPTGLVARNSSRTLQCLAQTHDAVWASRSTRWKPTFPPGSTIDQSRQLRRQGFIRFAHLPQCQLAWRTKHLHVTQNGKSYFAHLPQCNWPGSRLPFLDMTVPATVPRCSQGPENPS